jgi:sugar lactone lactonase YvrE
MRHIKRRQSFRHKVYEDSQSANSMITQAWYKLQRSILAEGVQALQQVFSDRIWFAVGACAIFLASGYSAAAQAWATFPSTSVSSGSPSQPVTITIQAPGTLAYIEVLTQGAPGLDFTSSGVNECLMGTSYVQGNICTIGVSFFPKYPGLRLGAVVLRDSGNHVLASQNLSGVGNGSLSIMIPGVINTIAGDGCLSDGFCAGAGNVPATETALREPLGEATDGAGNLYISDSGNNRIRKVNSASIIATIAGSEVPGFAGDGGLAVTAQINGPSAIAIDGTGNIFFADTGNSAIREINVTNGIISTVAGTLGSAGYSGNGVPATSALLSAPQGIAFDPNGNLYIADTGNHRIRKVDSAGTITNIAGIGTAGYSGDGGAPLAAQLFEPWGVAVANDGSIYIADFGNSRVRRIDPTFATITSVAGDGIGSYAGDGALAVNSSLNGPASVAIDPAGNLYIADSENNVIRKVNHVSGVITTIAGNGAALYDGGDGFNATLAGLYKPYSVYVDGAGNMFIADRLDLRIREVSGTTAVIQYPTMKEGKTSAPIAQKIENDGNSLLHLANLTASPASTNAALDTTLTDPIRTTCSISQPLAIDGTCILAVEFTPAAPGSPAAGILSVTSDSSNSPVAVVLTGTVLTVDPSSTTVTSNLNPAGTGRAITLTAQITSPNHVTGTVQFLDGGNPIGAPQPVVTASNTATTITSWPSPGLHTITASYSGDNLNAASNPDTPFIETIQQATALNVVPNANPVIEFGPLTFTATLAGQTAPVSGPITFTDTFNGESNVIGSGTPNSSGVVSISVSYLAVGAHHITAVFAGDANDFTSEYAFAQVVSLAPCQTTLNTSAAVAQFATPITLTATVAGIHASTPTGSVAFKDGSNVLATVPLNTSGVAVYTNSTLIAGTHTVTAVYLGDSNYATSTSSQIITETISQSTTATVLSSSVTSSIWTHNVTLTASVNSSEGSIPTGTIGFMNGNLLVGTATLTRGVASFSTTTLPVGTDSIIAIYSGDSNDTTSRSTVLAITVLQAPTSTIVTSSQNPLLTLSSVVITATVSNGGAVNPTGLVTFSADSVSIGVGRLNAAGIATITIPSQAAGSHTFVATYAGDPLNLPSAAVPLSETVQLRPTSNTLTTSETSLTGGQQITLISVVGSTGSPTQTGPTGTVTFLSGNLLLATAPVNGNGVATVTVILSGTSATLTSTYNGDANYAASSSTPTAVTIGPPPDFSVTATPSSWQMQSKQHLSVQLTLSSAENFADILSVGCSGLPLMATCTFSKDTTDLAARSGALINVIVDTGTPLLGGTQARNEAPFSSKVTLACLLPGLLALGFLSLRARQIGLMSRVLLFIGLIGVSFGLSGCGSIQNSGTPPGTYNFLITATSSTGVSHYVNMTMTITQ